MNLQVKMAAAIYIYIEWLEKYFGEVMALLNEQHRITNQNYILERKWPLAPATT